MEFYTKYKIDTWPTARWTNFSYKEIACSHCGIVHVNTTSMDMLQRLRNNVGRPLTVSSAYRCEEHPIEKKKIDQGQKPGSHTRGEAFDIKCSHRHTWDILHHAFDIGFSGIGIKQTGEVNGRFVHVDTISGEYHAPRPTVWTYG